MNTFRQTFPILVLVLVSFWSQAQNPEQKLTREILTLDSTFWTAYNQCDIDKMETFFTPDVEFYHDKGGLTTTSAKLFESIRKGLCGNPVWHLRREVVSGTVQVFPLNNYGAIISGEHYFYVNEKGKKEYLDGWAKFTHVWRYENNAWKMHRVLSYDHRPAPEDARKQFEAKQLALDATKK